MTTQRLPLPFGMPDVGVYPSKLSSELSLTNAKQQECMVMPAPTGSDIGAETLFNVPATYVGTPKLVLRGIIDGTPANVFGIGAQLLEVAAAATVDAAYEAEDVASNSTWTGYADEEIYELSITLTPASAFTALREVLIRYYRDDSVDTQTINFLLTELFFEFNDA